VEALLRSFFEHELPGELPPLATPRRAGSSEVPNARLRLFWPIAAALASAAALAVLVSWAVRPAEDSERSNLPVAEVTRTADSKTGDPATVWSRTPSPPAVPLAYSIVEAQQPLERFVYETEAGPVEQRADMHWTTVTVYEPLSGDRAVWMVPELTIEVVAVDQP
jgi:hypothetical protein